MCVRIKAVKPSIALTKTAPEVVLLCEDFHFKCTVKNTGTYAVGTLNPGETRKVSFVMSGTKMGAVNAVAIGRFVCARAKDTDSALAMVKAAAKTELRTIPALRLSLVDQTDLIKIGTEVTYTLQVINQGTGPDTQLTLKLTLPPELQYVSSEGSTVAKADGQVVAFGNVETLPPGKTVTWNIKCKATKVGDVRTTAELNSAYLKSPVTTTEPTRLIQ